MRPFFLPKEARIVIFMQINYLCSFSHLHKILLRLLRLEFYFAAGDGSFKTPSSRMNLAADFLLEYPLRTSSTFYLKIEVFEPCNKVVWWSKIEINEPFCCCFKLLRIFSSNSFTIFYKQWAIIWQTIAKPFSQYWSHICLAKKKL